MAELKVDEKDFEILEALKKNAKLSVLQLSRKTRIPPTTIHNRIKKLKQHKVITNYTIKLDREKIGQDFCAVVFIYLDNSALPPEFKKGGLAKHLFCFPQVDEVFEVAGTIDVIIKIYGKNIKEITEFIINNVRELKGVTRTETVVLLSEKSK
ncbi:MAG: Lrp/AsnC family transcriptional regulator [Candidatus Micrarchaeota archaeon]